MNLGACGLLPQTPENGVWYRCIIPSYLPTALSSAHTKKTATRFNPGALLAPTDQFATLHFADDPVVALFETGALLGKPNAGYHVPHPRMTQVTLNVRIILSDVIDLAVVSNAQVPLGTNAQELTGDWESYQIRNHRTPVSHPTGTAPTQELGQALFKTGVEGFRALSAKMPYHKTLVVFTDNLKKGSSLDFSDSSGTITHRIAP